MPSVRLESEHPPATAIPWRVRTKLAGKWTIIETRLWFDARRIGAAELGVLIDDVIATKATPEQVAKFREGRKA